LKENITAHTVDIEEILKENITAHTVDSFAEKSTQVKTHAKDISSRFQELEKSVKDTNTT